MRSHSPRRDASCCSTCRRRLRERSAAASEPLRLAGRTIAIVFLKPSTRTRAAFVVAAADEGAHPEVLRAEDIRFGVKESVKDIARVLGRLYDGIAFRGFGERRARGARGALRRAGLERARPSASTRPRRSPTCSPSATSSARSRGWPSPTSATGATTSCARSAIAAAKMGFELRILAPPELQLARTTRSTSSAGGSWPRATRRGARGRSGGLQRRVGVDGRGGRARAPGRAPARLQGDRGADGADSARDDTIYLHCLPALHDLETEFARANPEVREVDDAVFEGPRSRVFDQAENRMHTAKAVMLAQPRRLSVRPRRRSRLSNQTQFGVPPLTPQRVGERSTSRRPLPPGSSRSRAVGRRLEARALVAHLHADARPPSQRARTRIDSLVSLAPWRTAFVTSSLVSSSTTSRVALVHLARARERMPGSRHRLGRGQEQPPNPCHLMVYSQGARLKPNGAAPPVVPPAVRGKIVVITGAGSGHRPRDRGALLGRLGARLHLADIDADAVEAVARRDRGAAAAAARGRLLRSAGRRGVRDARLRRRGARRRAAQQRRDRPRRRARGDHGRGLAAGDRREPARRGLRDAGVRAADARAGQPGVGREHGVCGGPHRDPGMAPYCASKWGSWA